MTKAACGHNVDCECGAPLDDEPYNCPECGVGDAQYSVHERGCPSGFPTLEATGE